MNARRIIEAETPKDAFHRFPRRALPYDVWLERVAQVAYSRYRITPGDFEGPGGHEQFWEDDMTPEEYVAMIGEKYDLDEI